MKIDDFPDSRIKMRNRNHSMIFLTTHLWRYRSFGVFRYVLSVIGLFCVWNWFTCVCVCVDCGLCQSGSLWFSQQPKTEINSNSTSDLPLTGDIIKNVSFPKHRHSGFDQKYVFFPHIGNRSTVPDLREQIDDYVLSPQGLSGRGLFDERMLREIVEADRNGKTDNAQRIWQFLTLEQWLRNKGL